MTVHTKVGGAWKDVANANMFVKQGGDWENVVAGYVKVGGAWKQFHTGSNPVTYTFIANRSRSFRHSANAWSTTPGVGTSLRIGVFSGSSNTPYVGIFGFSVMQNGGLTLAQALAERPYITNVNPTGGTAENYIEFERRAGGIGNNNTYGTYYIARYNGDTTDSTPDADDLNFTGSFSKSVSGSSPFGSDGVLVGDKLKFDMNGSSANRTKMQTFVDHADTNPLAFANKNSISDVKATLGSGSADTEYAAYEGESEGYPPKLVITLDYVSA